MGPEQLASILNSLPQTAVERLMKAQDQSRAMSRPDLWKNSPKFDSTNMPMKARPGGVYSGQKG